MQKAANIFFILIFSICLASCVHTADVASILDQAQERLESNPDSAFVALDSLDRRQLNTKELRARHALLYSIALEKCGINMTNDSIINIAVDYYSSSNDSKAAEEALLWRERIRANSQQISPTDTLKRQQGRIIQERYSDKMKLIVHRRSVWLLILLSSVVLLTCIAVIRQFSIRLDGKPDDEAMALIRQRLAVLDKVLASYLSSDEKAYRISEEEVENLISDREEFLTSTKVVFKERHPKFIGYLEGKGLTDWEIGYCCLFTLGLKGKDVGEYIQKKRHYIISHEIRQKLGLGEHDTNIGIWLRKQLSELENGQM